MRALLVLLVAGSATAGTTPVSRLTTKSKADHHVALPKGVSVGGGQYSAVTIGPPYCVVSGIDEDGKLFEDWSLGRDDLDRGQRNQAGYSKDTFGLERLVVHGTTAELERTVVAGTDPGVATHRGHIPLVVVARADDLVVYAYRHRATVFLVTPTHGNGQSTFEDGQDWDPGLVERWTDCPYVIARVVISRDGASKPAQLSGTIEGAHGGSYRVDASITQTSRDPEPLLSVVVRFIDRP
ncbi:MAG: hypothetical protein JWO36_983 [Myxococcales bacterium]|nr:hypothetical protein [Myxococcales bacterium]